MARVQIPVGALFCSKNPEDAKEDGTWEKIYKATDVEPQLMVKAKEITAEINRKRKNDGSLLDKPSMATT